MLSRWNNLVVIAAIAAFAFAIGQVMPGLGIWFAIVASIICTTWSASRQRRFDRRS